MAEIPLLFLYELAVSGVQGTINSSAKSSAKHKILQPLFGDEYPVIGEGFYFALILFYLFFCPFFFCPAGFF